MIQEWPALEKALSEDESASAEYPTVFVNAANWPMGPKAQKPGGGRVQFGEAPFQPVIVDLLDNA